MNLRLSPKISIKNPNKSLRWNELQSTNLSPACASNEQQTAESVLFATPRMTSSHPEQRTSHFPLGETAPSHSFITLKTNTKTNFVNPQNISMHRTFFRNRNCQIHNRAKESSAFLTKSRPHVLLRYKTTGYNAPIHYTTRPWSIPRRTWTCSRKR